MTPNKSYLKSPYFRHVPISVMLDLRLYQITDVVMLKKHFNASIKTSVNDEASIEKISSMKKT